MVNPKIWGKPMWQSLVNIVKDYPNNPSAEEKQQYGMWFGLLGFVLPCEKCRANYRLHLQKMPIQSYLGSRMELATWLHLVYNKTLDDQGRDPVSFREFWIKFGNNPENGHSTSQNGSILGLSTRMWVLLLIVLALVYYYQFHRTGKPLASLMR